MLLAVAIVAAYANTFTVPFVFDDVAAITQNPSLTHLSTALFPPAGLSVTGRPLVNLSLAFNHAFTGESVWSYHAVNLALHLANALLANALLRRTFALADRNSPVSPAAALVASFAIALLWALHPLQTAAVTYVMQRSELLASFFILLALLSFTRSIGTLTPSLAAPYATATPAPSAATPASSASTSTRQTLLWSSLTVLAALAGMACKETAAIIPVLLLLYDRCFLSPSFFAALRARRGFYLALATTWLLPVVLLFGTDNRGASAGFSAGVPWLSYLFTQLWAVNHYLRLVFWPHPLIFDYGTTLIADPLDGLLAGYLVYTFLAGVVLLWRRRPALGFCGVAFFLLLAPTSLVPIATQTIAEHRLYLALLPLLTLVVLFLQRHLKCSLAFAVVPLALALAITTFARNRTYASALALWSDTVGHRPANPRAHYNLAVLLLGSSPSRNPASAETHLATALHLDPTHVQAAAKLGALRLELNRPADAVEPLQIAARALPDSFQFHYQLAAALLLSSRVPEALPHLADAIRLDPTHAGARANYGRALTAAGRYAEALTQFEAALRLDANDTSSRANADRLRAYLHQ